MTVKSHYFFPMKLQFFSEEPEAPVVEETVTPDVEEKPTEEVTEQVEEVAEVTEDKPAEPLPDYSELQKAFDELTVRLNAMEAQDAARNTEETVAEVVTEIQDNPEQVAKIAEYETALTAVVTQKLEQLPENIKALMPDNLSVAAQLNWVDKAEKAVPQQEQPVEKPVIESIGKPTPVPTAPEIDIDKLTASQKLSNYFQDFFGK